MPKRLDPVWLTASKPASEDGGHTVFPKGGPVFLGNGVSNLWNRPHLYFLTEVSFRQGAGEGTGGIRGLGAPSQVPGSGPKESSQFFWSSVRRLKLAMTHAR